MSTADLDADIDLAFVRSLPKAELHVHLEGTLEPATALACARRNGVSLPWGTEEELRAAYDFADLPAFLEVLFRVAGTLRQRQDFFDLAMDYLRHAHADGVTRAEVFVGSQTFLDAGVPIEVILDGVLAAFREAGEEWGIDARLICTAQRHREESTALELLDLIEPWREQIIGIGLGSAERGNPPSKFARFFAEAQRRGYRTTIHAGEDAPASYVVEALELGVDRIDHGVAVADDPALMRRVADLGIPLTMCPLSNVALKVVPTLAAHPLKRLLDAGVMVTLNSDDPPFFGGYVADNYVASAAALGLTRAELTRLAENSLASCWAPS
uniref:Adenine deaminase n=1 Tax=Streptomyces sp. NBC_01401 TaxID=2903854 RepID=A0AAU3GZQ5_9ACTN